MTWAQVESSYEEGNCYVVNVKAMVQALKMRAIITFVMVRVCCSHPPHVCLLSPPFPHLHPPTRHPFVRAHVAPGSKQAVRMYAHARRA